MSSQRFEPLSTQKHIDQAWQKAPDWGFAREMGLVPIAALELPQAVGHMPLAFVPDDSGSYSLVAVLGMKPNESLVVAPDGRFQTGYFPACLRTHPFRVFKRPDSQDRVVAIDTHHLVPKGTGEGSALFDDNGEPAKDVQNAVAFLKRLAASQLATERAIKTLADYDLLELWNPIIELGEQRTQLDGLYRVSQKALTELDAERLKTVQRSGGLDVAYAQLYSMAQIKRLSEWAGHAAVEAPDNLDELFGSDDDFHFDFDS